MARKRTRPSPHAPDSALVATADGTIDPAERQRVAQLIATSEVLKNFAADDLQRRSTTT